MYEAVDSLIEAVRAGAAAAVWDIVPVLIPAVLARTPPGPSAPHLLALATTAADAIGAHAEIPGVAEIASHRGSSRLTVEAARLLRVTTTS